MIHKSHIKRQTVKKIDPTVWVFLLYFALFIIFFKLAPGIIGALTLGWFLSMIIEVPARLLSRIKFISYKLATVISGVFAFALLAVGLSQLFPILIDEGTRMLGIITTTAGNINLEESIQIGNEAVRVQVIEILQSLINNLSVGFSDLASEALNWIIQNAAGAMTATLIFVVAASYFTALIPAIRQNLWRFFPRSGREKTIRFIAKYYADLRHFIRGQIIIAALVGLSVGVGMLIAGVRYALFLGFLSGITNFIPFLGLLISAIPALLLGLTNGGLVGILKVFIVLLVTNQLESWVFAPRIQGKRMKLNWFVIILAVFLTAQLMGVVGVLLAIPFLVFFRSFWMEYVQDLYQKL